jgi:hypothetical protein
MTAAKKEVTTPDANCRCTSWKVVRILGEIGVHEEMFAVPAQSFVRFRSGMPEVPNAHRSRKKRAVNSKNLLQRRHERSLPEFYIVDK